MSHRLLLVEDDPSNARLFRLMCEGAGYEVLEAADGLQALECLSAEPVDLVLMDLQMPGLDGLSVTRTLQERSETARLPVVIATGWADSVVQAELLAAGARAVLLKPFTRQALLDCLERVLQVAARPDGGAPGR